MSEVKDKVCVSCGKGNTEFLELDGQFDMEKIFDEKVTFKPNTRVKKIVYRYVKLLLSGDIKAESNICQSCVSKGFRSFRKDV